MSETEPQENEAAPRPFVAFLAEQRNGALAVDLGDALHDAVEAVAGTGKPATVTLTLKVKPAGKSAANILVSDDVTTKLPKPERAETVFFVDGHHNLRRDNPDAPKLPLREVGALPKPQPKEASK